MQPTDVLARGFLPAELPTSFSTAKFAAVSSSLAASVPRGWTMPVALNLARPGTLRRRLAIPNPFSQRALVDSCSANWAALDAHLRRSSLSLSRPVVSTTRRALKFRIPFSGRPAERIARMCVARFILQADISECYRSIYTHSLEWALHAKETAKANLSGAPVCLEACLIPMCVMGRMAKLKAYRLALKGAGGLRTARKAERPARPTVRPYLFRGRIRCAGV